MKCIKIGIIYINFWPRDGEGIAQAWGRLKSLMRKCPNHNFLNEIILNNFYARLSRQDKDMLDASSMGSFTNQKVDVKRDLIERIQRNAEDWEIDKGKESGINYEYDCIKSFVETDNFNKLSAKFGLDSQIGVYFLNLLLLISMFLKIIGPSIMNLLKTFAKKMK